ncbi:MAG: hypothetical protein BGP01_08700 [Paludibacter sp. 47-17]|nr:MAG: hypothetical protein BGP01_08700 [Paludibacter sp. 47-17]
MNTIRHYITGLLALLILTGCDDMLNFSPELQFTDENTWTNAEAFAQGANNFYTFLPKIQDDNFAYRDNFSDLRLVQNNISNSTYTIPESDAAYNTYYSRLRNINYLIQNAKKYSKPDEIKQYVAEAHFFRAYVSFLFFRDFGPGAIVKEVLNPSSPQVTAARATRQEFADFIIEDLEYAIALAALPKQADITSSSQNGRITIGAAQALLSRVTLFEGTWHKYHSANGTNDARVVGLLTKSKNASLEVMNDNSYELFYNSQMGNESYRYMFILQNSVPTNPYGILKSANKEYIFRNRFNEVTRQSNTNIVHTFQSYAMSRAFVESFEDINGNLTSPDYSTDLYSYVKDRDPRLATTQVPRLSYFWNYASKRTSPTDFSQTAYESMTIFNTTANTYASRKYSIDFSQLVTGDGFDVPIIRLAEVYLNYAEAVYELTGTISQTELDLSVNKIRIRAGMPIKTTATLDDLRRERTTELFLEGFRYDDIRRWKQGSQLLGRALEGLYVGAGSPFAKVSVAAKVYNPAATQWVALLKEDALDARTKTAANPDTIMCLCDPADVLNYSEAHTMRRFVRDANGAIVMAGGNPTYTSGSTTYVKSDPRNALTAADNNGLVSDKGFWVLEKAEERVFSDKYYLRPIPTAQLELNPNLVQNPHWNE